LIVEIKKSKRWATNQLYLKHMNKVRNTLVKKGCPINLWLEYYNDAFILFHNRIVDERFLEHDSLAPWLITVSYRRYLSQRKKNVSHSDVFDIPVPSVDIKIIEKEKVELEKVKLKRAINELSDSCRELINLSFSDLSFSAAEIAEILNFKNPEVVYTKKSRCLSNLKNKFNKY